MNIKIQGGGGKYANTGSSFGVANYLNHENKERQEEGKNIEEFFNGSLESVVFADMVQDLDRNKRNLGKKDAKFYVLTVSPSAEEQAAMGETEEERSNNFKVWIKTQLMQEYAESFGKGLNAEDIKYYAKTHHSRRNKKDGQMHAHIIVSRKDENNNKKLSPLTNHRNTNKGKVQGGFDRSCFFTKTEQRFDKYFQFKRDFKQSYKYLNTMKNGSVKEKLNFVSLSNRQDSQQITSSSKISQLLEITDVFEDKKKRKRKRL